MKHRSLFILSVLLLSIVMSACKEGSNIPMPGDNSYNQVAISLVDTSSCTVVTIKEALVIIDHLNDGETTAEMYKISGTVTQNNTAADAIPDQYTNINFTIKDESTTSTLACWYTNNLNNRPFTATTQVPLVGSKLTVIGPLCRYVDKSGAVKPEMTNGFICRIDSMIAPKPVGPLPDCPEPAEGQISVSKALEIGNALALGATTSETYDIIGVVSKVEEYPSTQYNNATFYIQDNTKAQFYCFRVKKNNGQAFNVPDALAPGDIVVVRSKIMKYNKNGGIVETPQNQGNIIQSNNPNFK